ncbi:protein pinocchio [Brevipalpus obovatus]|uniref:protein pinocchio n=1 Tax=Brevipalpus obovatus TaxID=246614 RepID=UPI003D9F33D4
MPSLDPSKEKSHGGPIQEAPTIETLRNLYNSCFTCGVSWHEAHISLDCRECGGYALQRPCPECDGKCSSYWKRNISNSHEKRKAIWEGKCNGNTKDNVNPATYVFS